MTDYHCYLCQHKWEGEVPPQYRYTQCPKCGKTLIESLAQANYDEKYFVRVQLIRSDKEGEYISQSFDYEVSPTTDPSLQDPLFIRAEKFYRELQTILGVAGKVSVTDRDNK